MSAGAYTSVPDVLDYLVTTIGALPACAAPVRVSDGWEGTHSPQTVVTIGGPDGDVEVDERGYVVMGNGPLNMQETYRVPIAVRAWVGGTNAKTARDAAFTIYKAVESAVRADPNLGGAISKHYPAFLGSLEVQSTKPDGSARGRVCELRTALYVRHRF